VTCAGVDGIFSLYTIASADYQNCPHDSPRSGRVFPIGSTEFPIAKPNSASNPRVIRNRLDGILVLDIAGSTDFQNRLKEYSRFPLASSNWKQAVSNCYPPTCASTSRPTAETFQLEEANFQLHIPACTDSHLGRGQPRGGGQALALDRRVMRRRQGGSGPASLTGGEQRDGWLGSAGCALRQA